MDTVKAIPHPAPQAPTADTTPPWLEDDGFAPTGRPMRAMIARDHRRAEAVHWSVTVLTPLTAACVLLGAEGGEVSHSRELLPVMITVTP